jgi:molecular chaperone GrpE
MNRKKPLDGKEDEDVVPEAPDSPVGEDEEPEIADVEENFAGELKKWKEKLAACEKDRKEYLDGWQRAKADYLNSQQRAAQEREREIERQTARFIERILPLADSFDRAREGLEKSEWRASMEQIYNQLASILKSYGVETIEPKGETFDPRFHEALSESTVADAAQDHTVLEVLQKGYAIGERLIRPAKVVVGNYKNEN